MSGTSPTTKERLESLRTGEVRLDEIVAVAYQDLRKAAHQQLRKLRPGQTLHTTALVHEAYLRLNSGNESGSLSHGSPLDDVRSRSHFLALAARCMRFILIDYIRERKAQKRGGDQLRVTFDDALLPFHQRPEGLLAIDGALERLAKIDERMARVVECRFFAGLTSEETAEALEVSARTVERDWLKAKAWLEVELS